MSRKSTTTTFSSIQPMGVAREAVPCMNPFTECFFSHAMFNTAFGLMNNCFYYLFYEKHYKDLTRLRRQGLVGATYLQNLLKQISSSLSLYLSSSLSHVVTTIKLGVGNQVSLCRNIMTTIIMVLISKCKLCLPYIKSLRSKM